MIYDTQKSSHGVQDITNIGLEKKKTKKSEDFLTQVGQPCKRKKGLDGWSYAPTGVLRDDDDDDGGAGDDDDDDDDDER